MLTEKEKEYLKQLVKRELKNFEDEKSTLVNEWDPTFLAAEERFDQFLKNLLKKLG